MRKTWKIEFDDKAAKELRKLDQQTQKLIVNFLKNKILNADDPKSFGKALLGNLSGFWRYRVEKYRIICDINSDKVRILVLKISHRDGVYNKQLRD
jgi:mRNA interferase RelE/StbE